MKYLLLLTLLISCKQNQPSNCNYQLPKDYCLYYNSNTKEYIVGSEKHDTVKGQLFAYGFTIIEPRPPVTKQIGDSVLILDLSKYWAIDKRTNKPQWLYDNTNAVRFSDSCIAKGTVEQFFKEKAIKDSINKQDVLRKEIDDIKRKHQDSLNNAFQPINCIK